MRKDMAGLAMKVSDNAIKIQDNKAKIDHLIPIAAKIASMNKLLLDLKNRIRQYNMHIFNLPEDVESND